MNVLASNKTGKPYSSNQHDNEDIDANSRLVAFGNLAIMNSIRVIIDGFVRFTRKNITSNFYNE